MKMNPIYLSLPEEEEYHETRPKAREAGAVIVAHGECLLGSAPAPRSAERRSLSAEQAAEPQVIGYCPDRDLDSLDRMPTASRARGSSTNN
jgi:hypothetical protein